MPHRNSRLKVFLSLLALFSLLILGVWSALAQDDGVLPLPAAPGQTQNGSFQPITLGGLLTDSPAVSTNGQVILPANRGVSRLFAQSQQILPPAIAGDQNFGIDLGRDGDWMVVGAPLRNSDTGAAMVYQQNASGAWVSPVILTASDGAAGDQFGTNVAIYGETIFVGAPYVVGPDADLNEGAVYIFQRDTGGNWIQTQKLQPILAADSSFGAMIKLDPSGTQMIIGSGEGAGAFIYRLESGTWQYETQLPTAGSTVGLYIEGNLAFVGNFTFSAAGEVLVFEKSAGAWTQTGSFAATDGEIADRFGGRIVYFNGQVLVLGDLNNEGAVYAFEETGGLWTQQQKLTASDGSINDGFGISFSPDGNTLAIGAALDETGLGSVYIFKWNGTAWVQDDKIAAVGGYFGIDVILTGSELLVGAALADTNVGRVYAYADPDLVPTETPVPPTETPTPEPATELLVNGGFESDAAGWTIKNATSDKVKCNKTGKTFSYEGSCAWRFKGIVGENAKIEQTITSGVDSGDTLTLSGFVDATGDTDSKVKVVVKYLNPAIPKNKITVNIFETVTLDYVPLSFFQPALTTDVVSAISKVKLSVKNQGESGKVYYDALSLTVQ
jgi:hypothetical protein